VEGVAYARSYKRSEAFEFLFSLIIGFMDEALPKGRDNNRKAIAILGSPPPGN
jgi:hypothetical protein